MSLKDLQLRTEYRSDKINIVDGFYIPCLIESIEYCRAVGYFTSRGLILASRGLAAFIGHEGRMRLIASPLLDMEDIEAIKLGYHAREDILEKAILRQFKPEHLIGVQEIAKKRLSCLAWLIAEERLDIKIALPSINLLAGGCGIYHEKVGIFIDSDENSVAFTGSPNETVGGLASNFESIDVFISWDDPHERTVRKKDNFKRLWNNTTQGLTVLDFPIAAKDKILQFRTASRPKRDPESGMKPQLINGTVESSEGNMLDTEWVKEKSMFDIFLKDHINVIKRQDNPNGCLLIYKGFPLDFVLNIGQEFNFLNDATQIYIDKKLELNTVVISSGDTIRNLLSIENGIFVATYEELLAIDERIDLSLIKQDIIVFSNNLFEWYPNQTTSHFPNLDKIVEEGNPCYEEDDLLNRFYVYSDEKFGITLLQYRNLHAAQDNVVFRNFFDTENIQIDKYVEVDPDEISNAAILASEQDEDYFNVKYMLFGIGHKIPRNINIVTDMVTLKSNTKQQIELQLLKDLYSANGYSFNIQVKLVKPITQCRKEFRDILLQHWGSDTFRDLSFYDNPDLSSDKKIIDQGVLIEEIVKEVDKAQRGEFFSDIFITSPTGSGKSVLFQIPAIYLDQKESLITIIISPLKALMYDQVTALGSRNINSAAYINSDLSLIERENIVSNIKAGNISIIYLSPELLLAHDIRQFIGDERKIGLLVIDEAHLVTTWGRDFRIDYWYLGAYIKRLRKYMGEQSKSQSKFPVLALTATAVYGSDDDIVFETVDTLNMQAPKLFIGNVRRDEISFDIRPFPIKGVHELVKLNKTEEIVTKNIDSKKKTIVYFPWINQIKSLMANLSTEYLSSVGEYYGDVEKTRKQIVMDKFKDSKLLTVLATKAFGMGVDVDDIMEIYHHAPSGNLSDYIQEIGRVARKQDLLGTAAIDFCPIKDLKFTRQLYGLSRIRQYQIKYVLEKIDNLYRKYQRRHMLVSAEDFGFIFSDKTTGPNELETKVKSALLLLEKDLYNKVNEQYMVIMVRPKALYSVVFACVPKHIEVDFLKKYGGHCKLVALIADNLRKDTNTCKTSDMGNIYELELNKIWENYFTNESFPKVKYKFFGRELFTEFGSKDDQPFPRYKLSITLARSGKETFEKILEYFDIMDKAFRDPEVKKEFTGELLTKTLRKYLKNEVLARRITNLLTNLYSSGFEIDEFGSNKLAKGAFLHARSSDEGKRVYSINHSKYAEERSYVTRKYNLMFKPDQTSFEKYITATGVEGEYRIKIAYLIESLLLGSYEVTGGKLSQIYLRINEPYKLQQFSRDPQYSNAVLRDIDQRHRRAVEQMERFFTSKFSNDERWSYIEDFFLGRLED